MLNKEKNIQASANIPEPHSFQNKVNRFATALLDAVHGKMLPSAPLSGNIQPSVSAADVKLSPDSFPYPELFPSPQQHYRARMEFSLHRIGPAPNAEQEAEQGPELRYVMFDKATGEVQRFTSSAVPLACIAERMPKLLEYLQANAILTKKLFQINWRADLDGQVMLTLIYHRKLEPDWLLPAQRLAQILKLSKLIGRSKAQVLVAGQDSKDNEDSQNNKMEPYLDSVLQLEQQFSLKMRQSDTCFSQPNAYINLEMLRWARQHFAAPEADLLELYCGIGNFTCALAPQFRRVLATEVVRQSIELCKYNVATNGLDNVHVVRLSAAETAEALSGARAFQRLSTVNLKEYQFSHLLLDPPRSGLDEQCRSFATNFAKILYVSCNPAELIKDLVYWRAYGYGVYALAAFDQFPHTEHLEVACVLQR